MLEVYKLEKKYPQLETYSGEITEEEYISIREVIYNQEIIDKFLSGIESKGEMIDLYTYLSICDAVHYLTGKAIIPDEVYDTLHAMVPEDLFPNEAAGKYSHKYPELRGTLEKIHFNTRKERENPSDKRGTFEEYLLSVSRRLDVSVSDLLEEDMRLSLKADGVSVIFELDEGNITRALKRGDVERNLAQNIPVLEDIDLSDILPNGGGVGELGLKTEVVIDTESFKELNRSLRGKFDSPRSAVTSLINSTTVDSDEIINIKSHITVVPLQYSKDGEVHLISKMFVDVQLGELIKDFHSYIDSIREDTHTIPADGVVISFKNENIQNKLGRRNGINQFEIAYKFPAPRATTVLEDVIFSQGALGGITPVAQVKPVLIEGYTIDSPSLGSLGRLQSLNLKRGQNVWITHDIVPYLIPIYDDLYNSLDDVIEIPVMCSGCGKPLSKVGTELSCTNWKCPDVVFGRILNYITKTSIEGISNSTVRMFMENGFLNSIEDLYRLRDHMGSLIELERMGAKSITRILDSIDDSRSRLKDYEFYGSIGVRTLGRTILKKIFEEYPSTELIPDILSNEYPRSGRPKLNTISGIGDRTENLVLEFVNKPYVTTINDLVMSGHVTLLVTEKSETEVKGVVVFTGLRDGKLKTALEEAGFVVRSSYSKNVDILITKSMDKYIFYYA